MKNEVFKLECMRADDLKNILFVQDGILEPQVGAKMMNMPLQDFEEKFKMQYATSRARETMKKSL